MARTAPNLATLMLLTGVSVLSLNMILPALAQIAAEFGAPYATASLAVSGYLAVTAVVQLLAGPLSDRLGRRPVVLGALALFTAASAVCAVATDIRMLLAARMVQAAMAAGGAISMAIVRDTVRAEEAGRRIAQIAMAMAIAPMLAPMLGGAIDTLLGWRAVFWLYAGLGLVLLTLCSWDLGETRRTQSTPSRPQDLLREPRFWGYAICTAFSTGGFFVFLSGAPLVAEQVFGMTTAQLGLGLGSITAGFMAGSTLTTVLAHRVSPLTLMLIGRSIAVIGPFVGLCLVWAGFLSILPWFASAICVGFGNGLTSPNSNAGAVSVRPDLAGSAAGWSGALTVACGAALSSVTGGLVNATSGPWVVLALMSGASAIGLAAVLWLRQTGK